MITISSGHSITDPGAVGYIQERREAVKVVDRVVQILKSHGVTVNKYHDNVGGRGNIGRINKFHNSTNRKLDISVHFNSTSTSTGPKGTEVLHYPNKNADKAKRVSSKIAKAGGFRDRGNKPRGDLGFLRGTHKPALLIEVCFVSSKADTDLYKKNFENICQGIAKALMDEVGVKYTSDSNKPPVTPSKPKPSVNDTPKEVFRVKSGLYSSRGEVKAAIDKLGKYNIANPKFCHIKSTKDGRFYFVTGGFKYWATADSAGRKMINKKILWNYQIIK